MSQNERSAQRIKTHSLAALFGLVFLGILGIFLPYLAGVGYGWPTGFIMLLLFWCIPGLPFPILHDGKYGWQPFIVAFPTCVLACWDDIIGKGEAA